MRAKGPVFFIGIFGVFWGIFMMAMMSIAQFAISRLLPGREIEYFFEATNLLVYSGIFLVIGIIWAAINWFVNERRFKQHSETE